MNTLTRRLFRVAMPMVAFDPNRMGLVKEKLGSSTMFVLFDEPKLSRLDRTPILDETVRNRFEKVLSNEFDNLFMGAIVLRKTPRQEAWHIGKVLAHHGYGPLMYRIAMSYACDLGKPWIGPDSSIKPEARKIWHYFSRDEDVESKPNEDEAYWDSFMENVKIYKTQAPPEPNDADVLTKLYRLRRPMNVQSILKKTETKISSMPGNAKILKWLFAQADKRWSTL